MMDKHEKNYTSLWTRLIKILETLHQQATNKYKEISPGLHGNCKIVYKEHVICSHDRYYKYNGAACKENI
eukprot:14326629-Ditylum_brightwellii.AAC.1